MLYFKCVNAISSINFVYDLFLFDINQYGYLQNHCRFSINNKYPLYQFFIQHASFERLFSGVWYSKKIRITGPAKKDLYSEWTSRASIRHWPDHVDLPTLNSTKEKKREWSWIATLHLRVERTAATRSSALRPRYRKVRADKRRWKATASLFLENSRLSTLMCYSHKRTHIETREGGLEGEVEKVAKDIGEDGKSRGTLRMYTRRGPTLLISGLRASLLTHTRKFAHCWVCGSYMYMYGVETTPPIGCDRSAPARCAGPKDAGEAPAKNEVFKKNTM